MATLGTNILCTFQLAALLAVASCAVPKAKAVAEVAPPRQSPAGEPVDSKPGVAILPDDRIRLPDMLGLPGEEEFRSRGPSVENGAPGGGAVVARPPSDSPSHPATTGEGVAPE